MPKYLALDRRQGPGSSSNASESKSAPSVAAAAGSSSTRATSTKPPPPPPPPTSHSTVAAPRSTPRPAPSSPAASPAASVAPTSAAIVVPVISSLPPTWITVVSTASPAPSLPTTQSRVILPSIPYVPGTTVTDLFPAGTDVSSNSTASPFFQNKGAVAATFIVVGLIATAILSTAVMFCIRKRRERQFERDVALTTAHAERTTRPPPSDFDDDDDDGRLPPMRNASTSGMVHRRNIGYAGAYGAVTAAAGVPYKGNRNLEPGVVGYGATTGAGSTAVPSYHTRPRDEEYYNATPYDARNRGAGGYPPQTQAAYSSSHGHDAYADHYNGNAGAGGQQYEGHPSNDARYGQQYGQAYGDPYAAYGGQPQIQPQQRQYQTAGAYPSVGPPNISSRSPPQSPPNRVPIPNPATYNNRRTPAAPTQDNSAVGRGLMDDASSARSWYSDDEEAKAAAAALAPKRSLRVANE